MDGSDDDDGDDGDAATMNKLVVVVDDDGPVLCPIPFHTIRPSDEIRSDDWPSGIPTAEAKGSALPPMLRFEKNRLGRCKIEFWVPILELLPEWKPNTVDSVVNSSSTTATDNVVIVTISFPRRLSLVLSLRRAGLVLRRGM